MGSKRDELPPFVVGAVGLMLGGITFRVAWTLNFPISEWHHGLFMLAFGFAALGYGIGGWAMQRAREERDEALRRADLAVVAYEALQATVARSLSETRKET